MDLSRLNPNQREAVLHGNGPLLVLAGAGSGKTSTMAYRIAYLLKERKQPADTILGLSFTRKAANELKQRATQLAETSTSSLSKQGLTVTTFHSLCVRILRNHAAHIGFDTDFTILDSNDQADIIRENLRNIKIDDRKFDPASLLFSIGQAKNKFIDPSRAEQYFIEQAGLPSDYALAAATVFPHYQASLKALNAMDFDDLLYYVVKLLEEVPHLKRRYSDKFRQILVDEYQDTNPAQFRLLNQLTSAHQNICVVGDDDQSIYSWRGADSGHILEFSTHFPAARIITLNQNYRSTSTILDAANKVISKNRKRHPKELWSDRGVGEPLKIVIVEEDRAEAEMVAEEILRRAQTAHEGQVKQERPWKDFAILYRSNPQSRLFEESLRMRKIPYKLVGTLSFLDRKEVKDVLSYWRLIVNPRDDASTRRVLNWPARGIGKAAFETIHEISVKNGHGFFETLASGAAAKATPRASGGIQLFLSVIHQLRETLMATPPDGASLSAWGKRSLELIQARSAFETETDDPVQVQRKWDNVDELCNSLGQLPIHEILNEVRESGRLSDLTQFDGLALLREYITRVTLNALDERDDKDDTESKKDQVTLLTLHGAKGLEYPVVFLVGMEEGLLPHRRTLEEGTDLSEERRLCYVGITRARDQLILSRAKHRIRYGKKTPRIPSRFLEEIPKNLLITQDESLVPDLDSVEQRVEHETKVRDFLAEIRSKISQ